MLTEYEIAADLDTPVSAFLKLTPLNPIFLLESVERGATPGRYSFLGLGSGFEFKLEGDTLQVGEATMAAPTTPHDLKEALRTALGRAPKLIGASTPAPFTGGLVGATSFNAVQRFEPCLGKSRHAASRPDLHYIAPTTLLIFDHATRRIGMLSSEAECDRFRLQAEIKRLLAGPLPAPTARGRVGVPAASFTQGAFEAAVLRAKEKIAAGEVYQLVLSNQLRGRTELDPFQVYRALRLINPSSYMFYCRLGEHTLVGASPEALVSLNGGIATLRPIAGTRRRGVSPEEDAMLASDLLSDEKERAEHMMLVDLARNDAGRVAAAGTVRVDPLMSVEHYSHVMHIVSGVSAKLADQYDGFDLFASAFPAGTLSGAPKIAALKLIDESEPIGRGFYGGAIGYFSGDETGRAESLDQAIVIRSITFTGDDYTIQSGAGIVADSDPTKEYEEVQMKAAAMRAALQLAEEGV